MELEGVHYAMLMLMKEEREGDMTQLFDHGIILSLLMTRTSKYSNQRVSVEYILMITSFVSYHVAGNALCVV